MRLNTAKMMDNEKKNITNAVREFQRREEDGYIYLTLDDFGKIERELITKPLKYEGIVIDVYAYPSGQIQEGGELNSTNFNILLSKLPREDKFYTKGELDIS